MLTVHGPGGPRAPDRKPLRSASASSGFRLPDLAGPETTRPDMVATIAAPGIGGPRSTLAPDASAADLCAWSHGGEMLDVLAQMQRNMLSAGRDPTILQRLATLADALPDAASPDLRQALRAVVTRAKVELARDEVAAMATIGSPRPAE